MPNSGDNPICYPVRWERTMGKEARKVQREFRKFRILRQFHQLREFR